MLCLARLTYRDGHEWKIAERCVASIVKLCPNKAESGSKLCQRCSERPRDSKALSLSLHGDLTEPPPSYSHIYGSDWFWNKMEAHDEEPSMDWLMEAEAAHEAGMKRCNDAGVKPWHWEQELDIMPPPKRQAATKQEPVQTSKLPYKPIQIFHQESTQEPKQLVTDTQKLVKEGDVWVSETGHRFRVKEDGGVGEYIRKQ